MFDIIVKKSKINGSGVFAGKDFKKDEIVVRWDLSRLIKKSDVQKISKEEKPYIAHVGGTYILMQPPARFVNHSCDSNTYVKDFCDVAKRDISKGEEITSDYSETETSDFKMNCNCGSKNCRGIIKRKKR